MDIPNQLISHFISHFSSCTFCTLFSIAYITYCNPKKPTRHQYLALLIIIFTTLPLVDAVFKCNRPLSQCTCNTAFHIVYILHVPSLSSVGPYIFLSTLLLKTSRRFCSVTVIGHVSQPYVTVGRIIDLYICSLLAALRSLFFILNIVSNAIYNKVYCQKLKYSLLT